MCPPEEILKEDVDVISPNAGGGVITRWKVNEIRAWAICGGANNILAGSDVAKVLHEKGILYIPDFLSSAGWMIDGLAGCHETRRSDAFGRACGNLCARDTQRVATSGRHASSDRD